MTLAEYRLKQGLTLEQLATQLGYSKSHLCEVEGSNRASLKLALTIETLTNGQVPASSLNDEVATILRNAAA
jgi:transcriptional regulator with XRE-family HTH domain